MAEPENAVERAADEAGRRASSFGAQAAAYAEHRPDYPEAAIRWALERCGDRIVVLDIGAGTGKLTGGLLAIGAEVIAVEPDDAMRAELIRSYPAVTALTGAAESIPLPDGSVDAVVAGQAMHWFDQARALPEIARVLREDGVFAALWNIDDRRVPWVAGLEQVATAGSSFASPPPPPSAALPDMRPTHPRFSEFDQTEFAHSHRRTAESLTTTLATYSHAAVMPAQQRAEFLGGISDYLRATPETSHGEFEFPLRTGVVRAVRRTTPGR